MLPFSQEESKAEFRGAILDGVSNTSHCVREEMVRFGGRPGGGGATPER